ncbi:MAG: gamma-glutamyltransferase [Planctomycetia bacterium]|nr:gamma-glutamyltransferase [Planctomycetia bacterium]
MLCKLRLFAFICVTLFFCYSSDCLAQEEYPENDSVPGQLPAAVHHKRAMVAAAHPLAAKIGTDILRAGGNAIDATVAVQMALTVVEPQSSGIGGGCFIVYYDSNKKQTFCFDGREETPAAARREQFLTRDGKVVKDALTGCRAAGVPGTVAGMYLAHQKFGKLKWKQLLQPAIELAEGGIGVTPRLRDAILANRSRFLRIPSSKKQFLLGDEGHVSEIGTVLRLPDLAKTLQRIADHGPRGFYEGETAALIVKATEKCVIAPGAISLEDLKNYRAIERDPISFFYRGYHLFGMPPPSSGTITLGIILHCLEAMEPEQRNLNSANGIDAWARAESIGFADRNAYLGDQDWTRDYQMKYLLAPSRLGQRRAAFLQLKSRQKAKPGELFNLQPSTGASGQTEGEHTTHFSIVDADRNIVSCTTTIEHGMGCGVVVEGAGFLLNNELTDFDLDLAEGANALDPSRRTVGGRPAGKRPRSSMTPLIIFKDNQPVMAVGSPGGSRIIGIVGHVVLNVLDHGMDMQEAINASRSSCRNTTLQLDGMFRNRAELVKQLESRGWEIAPLSLGNTVWGGAQGIRLLSDGTLEGGADPRREGSVRGY